MKDVELCLGSTMLRHPAVQEQHHRRFELVKYNCRAWYHDNCIVGMGNGVAPPPVAD